MRYTINRILCGVYQENAYLVCPLRSEEAFLVDPGDNLSGLETAIQESRRTLRGILLTHAHFDHTLAAEPLAEKFGCDIWIQEKDSGRLTDPNLSAYDPQAASLPLPSRTNARPLGETLSVCGIDLRVLCTPGHTPGSVCYYDESDGILFSGDTLFQAGFGRMDLPGGSMADMISSIRSLMKLPEKVCVYPGHGGLTYICEEKERYRL